MWTNTKRPVSKRGSLGIGYAYIFLPWRLFVKHFSTFQSFLLQNKPDFTCKFSRKCNEHPQVAFDYLKLKFSHVFHSVRLIITWGSKESSFTFPWTLKDKIGQSIFESVIIYLDEAERSPNNFIQQLFKQSQSALNKQVSVVTKWLLESCFQLTIIYGPMITTRNIM